MRKLWLIAVGLWCGNVYADQWTWDFDGNLDARGGIGAPLGAFGTFYYETATIGGDSAEVVRFLAGSGPDSDAYFAVTNPIGPNGDPDAAYTNRYTLIMDVRFPDQTWASLYQTNVNNANDGDWLIRADGGTGISGDYGDDGNPLRFMWGQWHRIVLVIDATSATGDDCVYRTYVDGALQNVVQYPSGWGLDGRFTLEGIFHIFADECGDTQDQGWVNSFQIRDYPMSDAALTALGGPSADGVPGDPPPPSIRVGPFLQSATPSSIWIIWETDQGEESRVDFGLTPALDSTAFGDAIHSVGAARIHRTQLTGLTPDTYYYYQASTSDAVSDVLHFRTPPYASAEQSFRFVAVSDTQRDGGNPTIFYEVINDGIISFVSQNFGPDMSDELAFIMNAGDLVDWGDSYSDWKYDFFDEAQNLFQFIPLYPVLGNHEGDSHWYFDYMQLPENGTPGYEEHWYYLDYGNVRIIGLDSNSGYRIQAQLDWLDAVLANAGVNPSIDFVFAQLHHPYKSESWTPGEIDYTGEVVRRLEQFSDNYNKPSIHFYGHTHAYSRGQSREHQHLWINVATGEGNPDYWGEYPQADYPEFQISVPEWGFVLVEVDAGNDPQFRLQRISRGNEVVPRANEVVDSITIRANNSAPLQPSALYPTIADSPVSPDFLSLQASSYSDPEADHHLESHFQITLTPGDYSNPIVDEWIRFENWYAPPGASGMSDGYYSVNTVEDPDITYVNVGSLQPNQTYYWRVRYRDGGLSWSEWSAETMFTTGESAYGPNVLVNPGAEQGVTGWTVVDPPLEVLAEDDCGVTFPPVSGTYFFAIGGVCEDEGPYGEAYQTVDVSADAAAIDAGNAFAYFGGYLRDWSGGDLPEIWLVFRDASGNVTGMTAELGAAIPQWTLREAVVEIPAQTRSVEFHMSGTFYLGYDNDSYLDELALRIGIVACAADLDGDGDTDLSDLAALLSAYGTSIGDPNYDSNADFDDDGDVDLSDLAFLLSDYACGS
ncbi:MAG: fibronectin type III domain-containing protein [Phycisphaerae bacterium]